jgi:transposase
VYGHPKKLHGPRIAPMPVRVIPQSMVGPGFLAHMLVSKFMGHIPYYRQQRIDRRGGLDISDKARVRYTDRRKSVRRTGCTSVIPRPVGAPL